MKNLTADTVANAIFASWNSAASFEDDLDSNMAIYAWNGVYNALDGMWCLVNCSGLPQKAKLELLDDIRVLRLIAYDRKTAAYEIKAAA
jgi:hypothetical protein